MALIKCNECGKEISDKTTQCIHCGCPIEKELYCNECGKKINKNDKVCKNCGCPLKNESETNNRKNIKVFTKIWLIFCSAVCFLVSLILCYNNIFNIGVSNYLIHIGNIDFNLMGALTISLGFTYIMLFLNLNKKNFIILTLINSLIFIINIFNFQMVINLFYILCVIFNLSITFFITRKELTNNKNSVKNYIPLFLALIIIFCLSFINSNNYNSDDYKEEITLTENEQKVYDTLVDIYLERAYNPQAVRVVSGNTLFGFKISGTNQIGGTITNCISLMPANYRDEDSCSSVHDDVNEDSEWYIDVYKINQKLEEYWQERGL